jgi:penicillin-binding protein 2
MAAYQRHNPRLFSLTLLLAAMLAVLAGGLAWRQVLLKPFVPYYNAWLRTRLQKDHPDWLESDGGRDLLEKEYLKQSMADYDEIESAQMLRCVLQPGLRGRILDRNGKVLVDNQPRYSVVLYVNELHNEFNQEFSLLRKNKLAELHDDTTEVKPTVNSDQMYADARFNVALRYLDQANSILKRNQAQVLDRTAFDRAVTENPLLPFTLIGDLTPEEYALFNAQMPVDSHMQTQVEALRSYPSGSVAFHTLGYVTRTNEIDSDTEPEKSSFADLWRQYLRIQPEDKLPQHITFVLPGLHGGMGFEKAQDDQLRGQTGGEIWVVDPSASKTERIAHTTPGKGADVQCSLDLDLQLAAEKAFHPAGSTEPLIGSAVAIDVRTGEVLAMAVSPTFDLNLTVEGMAPELVDQLNAKMPAPHPSNWTNRATAGLYPAGSTFKLIDTIAGLRAGLLDGNTHLNCDSSITFNGSTHAFHEDIAPDSYGNIDLVTALEKSSDVFFYQVGVKILGPDRIYDEARRLGVGQLTGVHLGEEPGLLPDPAWKMANRKDSADNNGKWTDDDTANLAIGQGYVEVTPLQMACVVASIARNETRTQPTLVHNPNLDPATIQHGGEPLGLTPAERQLLLTGMEKVVSNDGTGKFAQIPGLRIAGKTGTAQWGSHKNTNVAWFVCFAPIDNPQVAVAVAIETPKPGDNYYGGTIAGPVAKDILEAYFKEYPVKSN